MAASGIRIDGKVQERVSAWTAWTAEPSGYVAGGSRERGAPGEGLVFEVHRDAVRVRLITVYLHRFAVR